MSCAPLLSKSIPLAPVHFDMRTDRGLIQNGEFAAVPIFVAQYGGSLLDLASRLVGKQLTRPAALRCREGINALTRPSLG